MQQHHGSADELLTKWSLAPENMTLLQKLPRAYPDTAKESKSL